MKPKFPLCILPDCGLVEEINGLCSKHARTAYRLVKAGKTSWKKLIAAGRARPSTKKRGRPATVRDFFLTGAKP